jgi:cysteine desulfurase/selenocysteine lyase
MNISGLDATGLPQDWPDAGAIERLANQFFSALPNGTPPDAPASPLLEAPDPSNPLGGTAVPALGLPGDAELRALLAQLPPTAPTGAFASAPSTPGFASPSLELPNPLGTTIPPVIGLPGEAELRTLLAPPAPPAGDIPGTATAPYYFLEYGGAGPQAALIPGFQTPGATPTPGGREPLDIPRIRQDFPILQERVHGRPLIWLDNAATTQKPRAVIYRLTYFYEHENSNIHRAAHDLAARATDAYEGAREKVRDFLKASSAKEIVFVRGATEAINLVAQSWGRQNVGEGDEILITWLEHHANIVPWQQLATEKGAKLKVAPVDDTGQVLLNDFGNLLTPKTKLVAFTQVSNALGTITPAKQIIDAAHGVGARVLLDGAQSVSHMPVDVQALNPDWFVFSGHKLFAPTGIGVLYGKEDLLNKTQPWQGGGNMIQDVTFERTIYQPAPARFEAGTGNIADAVGLGAAIDYLNRIGMERIAEYEHQLLLYATRLLKEIPGLRLIGTAADKAGVLSFVLNGHRTEDVGSALNQEGIAVRSGHHCAQPILRRFGVESTVRPSLAFYNTCADIDALVSAVARIAGTRDPAIGAGAPAFG